MDEQTHLRMCQDCLLLRDPQIPLTHHLEWALHPHLAIRHHSASTQALPHHLTQLGELVLCPQDHMVEAHCLEMARGCQSPLDHHLVCHHNMVVDLEVPTQDPRCMTVEPEVELLAVELEV